jgi:hypothetical protein
MNEFRTKYREQFHEQVDVTDYGVGSMVELVHALPTVFFFVPPDPTDNHSEHMLYCVDNVPLTARRLKTQMEAKKAQPGAVAALRPPRSFPTEVVPDLLSHTQETGQLNIDLKLKIIKFLFVARDGKGIEADNFLSAFAHNYSQFLQPSSLGYKSVTDMIEKQLDCPVVVKETNGIKKICINQRKYAEWAAKHIKSGRRFDIIAMCEYPDNVVHPGQEYKHLVLEDMPSYISSPDIPEAHWKGITIASVTNPRDFCIHFKKNQVALNKLMMELDVYFDANNADFIIPDEFLVEGLPCVAPYANEAWHRVVIEKVISSETVRVRFVDYGGLQLVARDKLRFLKTEFFQKPAFAVKVAHFAVCSTSSDGKWPANSQSKLLEYSVHEDDDPTHALACCFYKKGPTKEQNAKEPTWKTIKYEVMLCDTTSADEDVFICEKLVEMNVLQKVRRRDALAILRGEMTEAELYKKMEIPKPSTSAGRY